MRRLDAKEAIAVIELQQLLAGARFRGAPSGWKAELRPHNTETTLKADVQASRPDRWVLRGVQLHPPAIRATLLPSEFRQRP